MLKSVSGECDCMFDIDGCEKCCTQPEPGWLAKEIEKTAKVRKGVAMGDMDCASAVGGPHQPQAIKLMKGVASG